jgi:hypothetical protein
VSAPDLHRVLLHPLHRTGLTYMVTGGVAAIAYGEPRMTNDVDLVVDLEPNDSRSLISAFATAEYYVPPLEVIEEERQRSRGGHFNIIHNESALRADIYLVGDDPLHEWALARRRTAAIGGEDIWFAPLEYVIVRKLEYFQQSESDRHLRDIAGMLRVSGEHIDRGELDRLIDERQLGASWDRISGVAQ